MNKGIKLLSTGVLAATLLVGGITAPKEAEAASISAKFGSVVHVSNQDQIIDNVIRTGKSLMGGKAQYDHQYVPGRRMDCSGFTYYLYGKFGVDLHTKDDDRQVNLGKSVPKSQLRKGDLVFYNSNKGRKDVTHVAIYIGNGQVLHMANTASDVTISSLNSSWHKKNYLTARRVID
jgi:gamma-D-glutamyl-L-lysine dipeptidyl-peptidase